MNRQPVNWPAARPSWATRLGTFLGVYRKALDAFYTAGGATFLGAWQLTGQVSGSAARGLVIGLLTAGKVALVPNDRPPRKRPIAPVPAVSEARPDSP